MEKVQGVLSDADLAEMRQRNEQKVAAAMRAMGVKYVCHPSNLVSKNPERAKFTPAREVPVQAVLRFRSKGAR